MEDHFEDILDQAEKLVQRRNENHLIIDRVYVQTQHLRGADFVERLREIGRMRGLPLDEIESTNDGETEG